MKFWPRNVLELISNEEDKAFLISMMTDRKASMAGKDTKLKKQQEKKQNRKKEEAKRLKRWEDKRAVTSSVTFSDSTSTDGSAGDSLSEEESFMPQSSSDRKHKRSVKTGVQVHIPQDILKSSAVVQALVRNKVSSTAISAVMHEIITVAEGDPSKLSLSYTTTERYKLETIQKISEKIAENWVPPSIANIHWDGKLVDTADKTNKVERLPILLSGIGGIKLLGVPAIPYKLSSAGEKIAQASLELIKIWDCAKSLRGMVFDTTSSNTGAQTAASVSLQNALSKPLLWFACRHHIGEIILTHVWAVLNIETSKSPEISLFQRFQKIFPTISIADKNFDIFDRTQNVSKNEEIIALSNSYLAQPTSRDDYKELVQLTLLYEKFNFPHSSLENSRNTVPNQRNRNQAGSSWHFNMQ